MKKALILALMLVAAAGSQVNGQTQATPEKNTSQKTDYSFLWGLFKSKDYGKSTASAVHAEVVTSMSFSKNKIDTTQYEQKRWLWGAVQWTERKKSVSEQKTVTPKP